VQADQLIKGRLLFASPERLIATRGRRLLASNDAGNSWQPLGKLPGVSMDPLPHQPLSRLLRRGVHHLGVGHTQTLVIADRAVYRMAERALTPLADLHGSRPMALCTVGDDFYYGEYRANRERSPVHIWHWRPGQADWRPLWEFTGVRHIHGIFHDPYSNAFWVTTGDDDSEAAIWRTDDNFAGMTKIVGGSQQHRAVQLLFSADYVYFGSDTPEETNHLYRLARGARRIERLTAVGGSVFYGCKVADQLFFSTAVEPSAVNNGVGHAELWHCSDGANWRKLGAFKKDRWPMKLFQYGQILFPSGAGDNQHLYFSPFATSGHGITFKTALTRL
jgi:hypothetical protein